MLSVFIASLWRQSYHPHSTFCSPIQQPYPRMPDLHFILDPAPEKPVREKSLDLKDEKQVEVSVTNGDVKSQLVQEEIPSADPPRKKRNKFCQCC